MGETQYFGVYVVGWPNVLKADTFWRPGCETSNEQEKQQVIAKLGEFVFLTNNIISLRFSDLSVKGHRIYAPSINYPAKPSNPPHFPIVVIRLSLSRRSRLTPYIG